METKEAMVKDLIDQLSRSGWYFTFMYEHRLDFERAKTGMDAATMFLRHVVRQAIASDARRRMLDCHEWKLPAFRVTVEGVSRDLHPILRDEIYRVASEAVGNAFHHAVASQIEVEIECGQREFRLRVRDDGKGLSEVVLAGHGPASQYGVPGMRERAELIGGKLIVQSEVGAGTEVELCIPCEHRLRQDRQTIIGTKASQ